MSTAPTCDPATAERLAGQLLRLLEGAVDAPDRPLGSLPLLSGDEIRRVVHDWSAGPRLPEDDCVYPEIFERRAARTPDALALVAGGERLDYASSTPGPTGSPTTSSRSAPAPSGWWRCGPAHGGHDHRDPRRLEVRRRLPAAGPGLPAERVRYLLDDARPALVLDEAALRAVPATAPDTDPTDADRRAPLHPEHTAYVIHTSGSTGRPKGVAVSHRAAAHLLAAHRAGFVAEAGGGLAALALTASFSFDTSLEGVLLMADGHPLHLVDETTRMDPAAPGGVRRRAPRRLPRRHPLLPAATAARRTAHRPPAPPPGCSCSAARRSGPRSGANWPATPR